MMTLIVAGLMLAVLAGVLVWFVCDRIWHGLAIAALAVALLPLVAGTPAGDVSRVLPAGTFATGFDGKDQIAVASMTATILIAVMLAAGLFGAVQAAWRRLRYTPGMWLRLRNMISLPGALLAAEAFAIWTVFALPLFSGRATIREAWDTPAYWDFGVPVLLLSQAAAGYLSKDAPWKLALWTLAGHFLAVWLVNKPGSDLGLLPLSLLFIGVPGFVVLAGLGYVGRAIKG